MTTGYEKVYLGSSGATGEAYWILSEAYHSTIGGGNWIWLNGLTANYNYTDDYLYVAGLVRIGSQTPGVMRVDTDGNCVIQQTTSISYGESFANFGLSIIPNTNTLIENGQSMFLAKSFGASSTLTCKSYYSAGNSRAITANSDGVWSLALHNTDVGKATYRQPYIWWATVSGTTITPVLGRAVGQSGSTYDWTGDNYFTTSNNSKSLYAILTRYTPSFIQFLVRVNTSGTVLWQNNVNASSSLKACGIAVGNTSEAIYVMYSPGSSGTAFRIQKFDNNGTSIWCKSISCPALPGTTTEYMASTVAITPDGSKVLFAPIYSGFVCCVEAATGNLLWARRLYTSYITTSTYAAIIATDTAFYWARAANGDFDGVIMKLDIDSPQTGSWTGSGGTTIYSDALSQTSSNSTDATTSGSVYQATISGLNDFPITATFAEPAGAFTKISL